MKNQEILFCHIEDDWTHAEECIEQAASNAFEDLTTQEAKDIKEISLYEGIKVPQSFGEYLSVDWLINDMQERAYDNSSEYTEDYLDDVTKEQKLELEQLIVGWANKHKIKPHWYMIDSVKPAAFNVPGNWKEDLK